MQVPKNSPSMLISHPEFKTSACCILILTIMVANSASGAALEGQVDDRSTEEEHQDWRQPLPTVSILVLVVRRCALIAHNCHKKSTAGNQTKFVG